MAEERMEFYETIIGFVVIKRRKFDGGYFLNAEPILFSEDAEDAGIDVYDLEPNEEVVGILPAPPKSYLVTFSENDGSGDKFLRYIVGGGRV